MQVVSGVSEDAAGGLQVNWTIFTLHSCFSYQHFSHRATTGDIDYIENQCVVEEVDTSCKYEVYEGQDIGYADIQVQANSAKEVRDSVNMQLNWASRLKKSMSRVDLLPWH